MAIHVFTLLLTGRFSTLAAFEARAVECAVLFDLFSGDVLEITFPRLMCFNY